MVLARSSLPLLILLKSIDSSNPHFWISGRMRARKKLYTASKSAAEWPIWCKYNAKIFLKVRIWFDELSWSMHLVTSAESKKIPSERPIQQKKPPPTHPASRKITRAVNRERHFFFSRASLPSNLFDKSTLALLRLWAKLSVLFRLVAES